MNTRSFLVCFVVVMLATSMAMAGSHHGNFAGGFARNGAGSFRGGNGSFRGGNWNGGNWNRHCHGGRSNFVFIGSFGFPFLGYPYGYGYSPYSYGYSPYGYGYGSGYYGYGAGYDGYGSGYYGVATTATVTTATATTGMATAATATIAIDQALSASSNN